MDGFPSSLSDYRPVDLLGQGATANVFKAHWRRTGQVVALKVIRPDASRQTRAAFQQGLRAWREVKHPHVAALIDEGATADGALYAAAEYVPSCSLRLHQARKRDSGGSAALELMGQVLDALAAIHEAGHVHGDLHANNILITETGARANVKLIDFGAATPRGGASPSADLYAWALLTIECLTGWPVLGAEERYTAARSGNARLPNALAGHPLAPLLSAILDPAPAARPHDAACAYQMFAAAQTSHGFDPRGLSAGGGASVRTGADGDMLTLSRPRERSACGPTLCLSLQVSPLPHAIVDLGLLAALQDEVRTWCQGRLTDWGAFATGAIGDRLLFQFQGDLDRAALHTAVLQSDLHRRDRLWEIQYGVRLDFRAGLQMDTGSVGDEHEAMAALRLSNLAAPGAIIVVRQGAVTRMVEQCGQIALRPLASSAQAAPQESCASDGWW